MNVHQVSLSDLVRDVVRRLADRFAEAHCEVTLRLDDGATGTGDSFRIEQVLVNLLTNAFKYGAGMPIEVTTRTDDCALLIVRDHGRGIARADQKGIFEKFERAGEGRHVQS